MSKRMYIENAPDVDQFRDALPNIGIDRARQREAYEKWIEEAEQYIKQLEHYRDATIGLWATDRPDLVKDPKEVMFRIVW